LNDGGWSRRRPQREYRDARTIQYAIDVGVELPDPTPPPVAQEFPCTDDGNGDRLVAQYRDSIRYCKTFDAWYLWDGVRWERDETCRMLALAKRVARTIHIEASATTDDRREKVGEMGPHVGDALADEGDDRLRCPGRRGDAGGV